MEKARIVLQGSLSHTRINPKGQQVTYLKDQGLDSMDQEEIEYCKGQSTFMVRDIVEPVEEADTGEAEGQPERPKKKAGRPKKKSGAAEGN